MRTASSLAAMMLGLGLASGLGASDAAAQSANCIDVLAALPDYSRFVGAVTRASLTNDVRNLQNITFFAPTNAAIQGVPPDLVDRLFPVNTGDGGSREADPVLARAALQAHIVQARLPASALAAGVRIQTMAGTPLSTSAIPGGERAVTVTAGQGISARIVQADIPCSNGLIQGIDHVLIR